MQKTTIKQLKQAVLMLGDSVDRSTQTVTLALSISDHRHRAQVQFIRRATFNQAWQVVAECLAQTAQHS